jgi:hypothetical protein
MEVLCKNCRFSKRYCTSNRQLIRGLYAEEDQLDLVGVDLYIIYMCRITNAYVENPFRCGYYETAVSVEHNDSVLS